MKNNFFLLIVGLGLLFFGLNYFFEFITFESSKVNPISIVIICIISLLFILKNQKINMKITTRDIAFFMLGIFTIFIIETLVDWEGSKKSFKDGYYKARGIEAVN